MNRNEKKQPQAVFYACIKLKSELNNIRGLRTAVAFGDIECYCLALVECLESVGLDCGIMYEYVVSVISCDESITFFCIEPLNFACCHCFFESPILCTQDMLMHIHIHTYNTL